MWLFKWATGLFKKQTNKQEHKTKNKRRLMENWNSTKSVEITLV